VRPAAIIAALALMFHPAVNAHIQERDGPAQKPNRAKAADPHEAVSAKKHPGG
jgi:hypothetical protein